MLARPAVGERKAKCPGRAYPSNEHEGDTNVDAAIRRHGEFLGRRLQSGPVGAFTDRVGRQG